MIDHHCGLLSITRKNALGLIKGLNEEQLNHIPKPFNNNLIWNLGHMLVTQQLLCYRLSGNESFLSNELIEKYRKGSQPDSQVSSEEINHLKEWLKESPEMLERDYNLGMFKTYKEYPTSYGVTLRSIEDAVIFNNMHESMHLGTLIALKKML
jgi:uncharacterized protein YbgA (DUF1722 family)